MDHELVSFQDIEMACKILAEKICNSWSVMGAEILNEPLNISWGDNGFYDWRSMAENLENIVTLSCPKWLLMVEGEDTLDEEVSPLSSTEFIP